MNDLLFEIGTEELPSAAVYTLAVALTQEVVAGLDKAGIQHGSAHYYATPRRLAVIVRAVETEQAQQSTQRRGPAHEGSIDAQGQPSAALSGFAKSCGVTVEQLTTLKTEKGEWWCYEKVSDGAKTVVLLPEIICTALKALPIAKSMRWGDGDEEFVRPVHWAVLLWGNEVVSCKILGVETARTSYGHRFHHPQAITIESPSHYETELDKAYVKADFAARRQLIVEQIQDLAKRSGFEPVMPETLLDEVTSIVEWPVALIAGFDAKFLDVPAEALIAAMQVHQKCFALRNAKGELVPHFITIANIESSNPQQVIAGNEKVMCARLSDAAFFYHQDKRQSLQAYRVKTADVVFQAKLGTLFDKSERLKAIMDGLVEPLQLNSTHALRAAELSKCDLMTGMVGEFPELQGLMGYYYALHDKEDEAVANALNDYYLPRFAADALPPSVLGSALSIADRMDTLVGAFALGQKPSGVKDPFKLRRHALAVCRLLIHLPTAPGLSTWIEHALQSFGEQLPVDPEAMTQLHLFILERLYGFYEGQSIRADVVHAVRARQNNLLFDLDQRVHAVQGFITRPEAMSLSSACKRVNNLLQQVKEESLLEINASQLNDPAEQALYERLQTVEALIEPHYITHTYEAILTHLASLREPIDLFFDQVMVMVDDEAIKCNRLALLSRLKQILQSVADISLLELSK